MQARLNTVKVSFSVLAAFSIQDHKYANYLNKCEKGNRASFKNHKA